MEFQLESEFKIIDVENWKRAAHYNFFRQMANPFLGVSYQVDITHFVQVLKEKKLPFYYTMIHGVTLCANGLDGFRYRIKEGKVILYDRISPSFRFMDQETGLFKTVTVDFIDHLPEFITAAKGAEKNQSKYFEEPARQDVYDISCIPWISFTHVTHTHSADKDYSAPNFTWGKHFKEGEKVLLPFSVQVHHSFADGSDLGKFAKMLQDYLDEFE